MGPLNANDFHAADFGVLETYEVQKRAEPVIGALDEIVEGFGDMDRYVVVFFLLSCVAAVLIFVVCRASYAHLVSMATSVISAIQQPDSSEVGLFDKPPRPRTQSHQLLESTHTCVAFDLYEVDDL